jgi:hypothetical protein
MTWMEDGLFISYCENDYVLRNTDEKDKLLRNPDGKQRGAL